MKPFYVLDYFNEQQRNIKRWVVNGEVKNKKKYDIHITNLVTHLVKNIRISIKKDKRISIKHLEQPYD